MTVVVGASGKTGRRVMQRLQARGVPARGASRSGDVPFDWDDRSTWASALRGATAAYVSFFPDLAVPGAPEAIGALAEEALERDVRRLVLLSGRGEEEAQRAEQVLQRAGIEWTVVRCTEVLDGRNAHVNDGVQRALGREPRDFADFARDAAARGVWEG